MNKLTTGIMTLIAAGTFAVTPLQATGADGVRIEHLGVNNTLVGVVDAPEIMWWSTGVWPRPYMCVSPDQRPITRSPSISLLIRGRT